MILVLLVSKMFINDVGCLTTKVSAFFVEAALSLKISQSPMICHKKNSYYHHKILSPCLTVYIVPRNVDEPGILV